MIVNCLFYNRNEIGPKKTELWPSRGASLGPRLWLQTHQLTSCYFCFITCTWEHQLFHLFVSLIWLFGVQTRQTVRYSKRWNMKVFLHTRNKNGEWQTIAMNEILCNLSFASIQQRCNSFLSVMVFLGNEGKKPEKHKGMRQRTSKPTTTLQNEKSG